MKRRLYRLTLIILGATLLTSCQRAQPIAATLETQPPQGQLSMLQLGNDQVLYCLTSVLDSTRLDRSRTTYVRYTLWRIPLDGAPSIPMATFDPGCDGIVRAGIVTSGSQVYLWYRCMWVDWEAVVMSGRAGETFSEVGRVGSPWCHFLPADTGRMTVLTFANGDQWQVSQWNSRGLIDSGFAWVPEVDDSFQSRWGGIWQPHMIVTLPSGQWLCINRSPIEYGASESSGSIIWVVYWVLDPFSHRMVSHGTSRLDEVAFGSTPVEVQPPNLWQVWQDSGGVGVLVSGGESRLFLLQWDNEGTLMTPPEAGRSALWLTPVEQVENPIGRALSTLGRGRDGQTDFRIWEIDRMGRIGYRDYRR